MAAVTDSSVYSRERADRFLSYLESEWGYIPTLAQEWPEFDPIDQEVLRLEWGIREDCLVSLQQWVVLGLLTPRQWVRYRTLLRLIERHRSTLELLFDEEEHVQERQAA